MTAMGAVSISGYAREMPKRARARKAPPRRYPNRLAELRKLTGMTNADIIAALGDDTHETTISRLATGEMDLTLDWMTRLAKVFGVRPAELIEKPPGGRLRRVHVTGRIQAGQWSENHEWPEQDQYDVTVPDDPAIRGLSLYAGEIGGESMNLRYKPGSVVVLSPRASDMVPGRRYHVRRTRPDGTTEETIKTLARDERGHYWLKPESSDPEHQEWISLEGSDGVTVELLGRVRYVVQRED